MKVGVLASMMAFLLVGGFSLAAQAGPAPDSDSDGTVDVNDFCSENPMAPDPVGCDNDNDGYGNLCDGDFNQDGVVTISDVDPFVAALNAGVDPGDGTDMNCDGVVSISDVDPFIVKLNEGAPGPSGLACAGTVPCP